MMKKAQQRRTVDFSPSIALYLQDRLVHRGPSVLSSLTPPSPSFALQLLPSFAYADNPVTSITSRFVQSCSSKYPSSVNCLVWTPNSRRVISGSQNGEFTVWNGLTFNFERNLQAHDASVRSLAWSHNDIWLLSADDTGVVKYWQSSEGQFLRFVRTNNTVHKESVRGLSFCSSDLKFASASDDNSVKVWDFSRCEEELSLAGHRWDVKCCQWHPTSSLIASGGKDHQTKLWDARTAKEVTTLYGHKNTVQALAWNSNGNWLASASKDQLIKLRDIRTMKDLESFKGHTKEVTAIAWHPFHEGLLASGSYDGSIFYWVAGSGCDQPAVEVVGAHYGSVWDVQWHPLGHLLASCGIDKSTKFWCRSRPGDEVKQPWAHSPVLHPVVGQTDAPGAAVTRAGGGVTGGGAEPSKRQAVAQPAVPFPRPLHSAPAQPAPQPHGPHPPYSQPPPLPSHPPRQSMMPQQQPVSAPMMPTSLPPPHMPAAMPPHIHPSMSLPPMAPAPPLMPPSTAPPHMPHSGPMPPMAPAQASMHMGPFNPALPPQPSGPFYQQGPPPTATPQMHGVPIAPQNVGPRSQGGMQHMRPPNMYN